MMLEKSLPDREALLFAESSISAKRDAGVG
jgi:hypothetical protein